MTRATEIANILKKLGDAHYQAADELLALASNDSASPERPAGPAAAPARDAAPASFDSADYYEERYVGPGDEPESFAPRPAPDILGECPDHQTRWRAVPGGVSKRTGKPYEAFWACEVKDCKKRPDKSWQRTHNPEAVAA